LFASDSKKLAHSLALCIVLLENTAPAISETNSDNVSDYLSDLIMEITSDFQSRAFLQTESLQKCGIALILLSSFAGAYGLHGLGWTGGMIQTLQGILNDPAGKFPGTDVLIIRKYTGATAVDVVLANMVPFFWPVVDGRYPPLTLFSFFMFGQYGVAWALFVMESLRKGNKKKVIS
jgi:hypothetical protein